MQIKTSKASQTNNYKKTQQSKQTSKEASMWQHLALAKQASKQTTKT